MLSVAVALLPVLLFLAVLVLMDSFKLVSLRAVVRSILVGCLAALAALLLNGRLLDSYAIPPETFSRLVAPPIEELLKALFVVWLVHRQRVGFLVDAAIHGFAVGAGFALVENIDYLRALRNAQIPLWIVRGFGTALLHGAATAILALLGKALADRRPQAGLFVYLPPLAAAAALHSLFNHLVQLASPLLASALLLLLAPLLLVVVFERSERATREWLGVGFDTDLELLKLILSGEVQRSRVGVYLHSLKSKFEGTVLADMLCLLRIHLELSIRAKAFLLAQEAGIPVPLGEDVHANLQELRYLEKSIGPTGRLALKPIQSRSSRDLWQLYMLQSAGA